MWGEVFLKYWLVLNLEFLTPIYMPHPQRYKNKLLPYNNNNNNITAPFPINIFLVLNERINTFTVLRWNWTELKVLRINSKATLVETLIWTTVYYTKKKKDIWPAE